MKNLSELLDLHNELDAMFFAHQAALLYFEFEQALSLLKQYENALLTHMRDEEEVLFPVYEERAEIVKGGKIQFFLDEHYKMSKYVELLKDEIAILPNEPNTEAKLIWIFDRESFYKRLCDHHDKRETDILYPELDRVTTAAEKSELLSRVTRAFTISKTAKN
jgi:iron-sulfur cluster repair protein YtfE (RIC family)